MAEPVQTRPWHYVLGFFLFGPFVAPILAGQKKLGVAGWLVTAAIWIMLAVGAFAGSPNGDAITLALATLAWTVMVGVLSFWLGDFLARRRSRNVQIEAPAAPTGVNVAFESTPPPPLTGFGQGIATSIQDSVLHIEKVNADVLIRYRDSKGHDTERLITVNSVDGHYQADGLPHIDMIHAYCHQRKMARSFRMDRVRALAEPGTGEIIADAAGWLGVRSHS